MSRRLRRTKIVTTLGPATDRDNNLEKVIAAGANVVRMNFSHGSPEDHKMRADKVREIARKTGGVMWLFWVTSRGPKSVYPPLKKAKFSSILGDKFLLDANLGKGEGDKEKVGIDYKGLPADVVPGDILLLDRWSRPVKSTGSSGHESGSPKSPSVVPSPTIKVSTNLAAVCRLKR
ncbi:pyruvate kinase [Escherichia coli]|nr:pyruvate kinase [Escherichia coli]